jgi:hypothetical protein
MVFTVVDESVRVANGMVYSVRSLAGSVAFVDVVSVSTGVCHFELWYLRENPLSWQLEGRGRVRYPSNEDFGSYGWSFSSEGAALKFLDGLLGVGRSEWLELYRSMLELNCYSEWGLAY